MQNLGNISSIYQNPATTLSRQDQRELLSQPFLPWHYISFPYQLFFLFAMGVSYHDHFSFRDGRELPWPFSFLQWAWVSMAIFLFIFFPQQAEVISTLFFLQWAGVTSTGLPTPTFHKSAQLEVISFTLFVSCPIPFTYCLSKFRGFKWFCSRLALFFHQKLFSQRAGFTSTSTWHEVSSIWSSWLYVCSLQDCMNISKSHHLWRSNHCSSSTLRAPSALLKFRAGPGCQWF